MRKSRYILYLKRISVLLSVALLCICMSGCAASEQTPDSDSADTESSKKETVSGNDKAKVQSDYDQYIHDALAAVSEDRKEVTPEPTPSSEKVINVSREKLDMEDMEEAKDEVFVSSSDNEAGDSDEETKWDTLDSDEEENSELTPDEFEVGQSSIYINGKDDETYGNDIITEINSARKQLGYPELTVKTGLNSCASRRAREVASDLSHTRPNGEPYYSLAPQYFKAEMLAIDKGSAKETVEEWIKDPVSRELVFNNKYTSVGGACFVCNELNCIVVAFGY